MTDIDIAINRALDVGSKTFQPYAGCCALVAKLCEKTVIKVHRP